MLQYSAISGPKQGVVEADRPPPDIATGENVDYCSLVGLDDAVTVNRAAATDGWGRGPRCPLLTLTQVLCPAALDLPTQPKPEPNAQASSRSPHAHLHSTRP